MTIDPSEVKRIAAEFVAEINAAYGLYLDAIAGFKALAEMTKKGQKQAGADDDKPFFYSLGDPTDPENVLLHQTTQGTLLKRIGEGGQNHYRLGRLLIVLLYELWETGYRTPLSAAAGVPRDQLLVPVFGDLRLLRHEVLHNKGRITQETRERLQVVSAPSTGSVDYHQQEINGMIMHIKRAVDEMVTMWTGDDPVYRTIWHVT